MQMAPAACPFWDPHVLLLLHFPAGQERLCLPTHLFGTSDLNECCHLSKLENEKKRRWRVYILQITRMP
jgi:hypothetical protein